MGTPINDLDEVYREVFGFVGDEPNIYADYDKCAAAALKMRRAIEALRVAMIPPRYHFTRGMTQLGGTTITGNNK